MDPYITEQEQIETLKKWWVKNGTSLLLTLSVLIAALGGYRYWQNTVYQGALSASVEYTKMMDLMQQDKTAEAAAVGDQIIQQSSGTPYAALAALAVAKIQVEKNEMTSARSHLIWVVDHSDSPELRDMAQLRLARVYFAEKNYDQALATLAHIRSADFLHVAAEVKGDVYVAQGDKDKARIAYQEAVDAKKSNATITKLKLEDLGNKS